MLVPGADRAAAQSGPFYGVLPEGSPERGALPRTERLSHSHGPGWSVERLNRLSRKRDDEESPWTNTPAGRYLRYGGPAWALLVLVTSMSTSLRGKVFVNDRLWPGCDDSRRQRAFPHEPPRERSVRPAHVTPGAGRLSEPVPDACPIVRSARSDAVVSTPEPRTPWAPSAWAGAPFSYQHPKRSLSSQISAIIAARTSRHSPAESPRARPLGPNAPPISAGGADRQPGSSRGGVFPQKIGDKDRVILAVLHLRKLCTLDALADTLGDVSRSSVGNVVREIRLLLVENGCMPLPAATRYRTAADLLAAAHSDGDAPTG